MNKNFGINVIGYIDGEFGLGEAVRSLIKAIQNANIPVALINFDLKTNHRHNDKTFTNFSTNAPYLINLVLIGTGEVNNILTHFTNTELFKNKYNIYFLNWESEYFPSECVQNISFFDEVWTPAQYCKDVISKYVSVPVNVIPYPIDIPFLEAEDEVASNFYDKSRFNFLFIFDYNSTLERKNPLNLIEAFQKAFGKEDVSVYLTIKTSMSTRFAKEKQLLLDKIGDSKNIKIVEKIFEKDTLNHIIKNCDGYISMHRSEGFGFTMAEAMYFSKPVIATGYSGNTEFMNADNSFLVDYEMCQVDSEIINYDKNTIWSNPGVDHAAVLLKKVRANSVEVQEIAKKAGESILNNFSVSRIGLLIENRITIIIQDFQVDSFKNAFINLYIENAKLKNDLKIANKSLLIKGFLSIKMYLLNRKENRSKNK
jgi:glycosyltransferase involved in cell wall biosynthesis